jgi:elongator complex protein 1
VNDSITIVLGPGEFGILEVQQFSKTGAIKTLASFPYESESNELLSFAHFADTAQLVFVFQNGDVILATYDLSNEEINPDNTVAEVVGSIDTGLNAASWSSDEETLVLVTNSETVLLLSRQFDSIAEVKLTEEDAKLSNHVDVGWGSEETQFKGKGAKQQERELFKNLDLERDLSKRDPTMPLYVDRGDLYAHDDQRVEISWRSDCDYFAINSIDTINGTRRRMLRVFSKDGVLDSVSEPVDSLEGAISWGNLITCIQRRNNEERNIDGVNVLFFERNGLKHGEFDTRLPADAKVDKVLWNSTNEVLAILADNVLYIWTTKNYHWYLKQEVRSQDKINFIKWHPEKNLTLLIGTSNQIEIVDFAYKTTRGTSIAPFDLGMNLVVDGSTANITPISIANVPPPISFRDFEAGGNILDIAVSRSNEHYAALTNDSVVLASREIELLTKGRHPEVISTIKRSAFATDEETVRQITFVNDDLVGVLIDADHHSRIILIDVTDLNDPFVISVVESPLKIVLIQQQSNWEHITYQTIDGSVHLIEKGFNEEIQDVEYKSVQVSKFPQLCSTFELVEIVNEIHDSSPQNQFEYEEDAPGWQYEAESADAKPANNLVAFGISKNGKLFANDVLLSSAITSMALTDSHLLITTAQHTLRFVHLNRTEFKPLLESTDSVNDERIRQIERGSLLVNVIPSRAAVVLQAPRGNLETINPRILVLAEVRRDIKSKNFKDAFTTCRTHRIDLDILHDYDPELFFKNVELFINQIDRIDYLDLFVSCLHEEDVSKTKYRETLSDEELDEIVKEKEQLQQQNDQFFKNKWVDPSESKVNKICEAILEVLLTPAYKTRYLQTIITAYACEKPANLESALRLITAAESKEEAEKATVHLSFLQDVNLLYNVALGLYDIKLTLAIAQQSQKDPKEYLPFLQNLHEQTELRRRFLIDTHLKKFEKAIVSLAELEKVESKDKVSEEFQDYVVEHDLYNVALGIFHYEAEKQDVILGLYARSLYSKQEYVEAGNTYELLKNYEDALEAYILGQKWREALSIVERPEFKDQLEDTADRLITSLVDAHKYSDAAQIQIRFLKDIEGAIKLYCKEYQYDEAILLAQKEGRPELIESLIDSGLGDGFGTIAELIADCSGQLKSQLNRLRELRTKKAEDPYAFYGQIEDSNAADDVSIAPSETSTKESFFTRYTGKTGGTAKTGASRRTAKNKRREERKKARGKKGTIYEEEYLVRSVGRLVERLEQTKPEAVRLIEGLIRRGMREQAYQIQTKFVELLAELKADAFEIYNISEKDRERIDENGEVYYIAEIPVPEIPDFPKKQTLNYSLSY